MVSRQHQGALFRPYSLIWLWTPNTPLPACYTGNSRFSCGGIGTGTGNHLPVMSRPLPVRTLVRSGTETYIQRQPPGHHFAKHVPNYRGSSRENGPSWWTFVRKIRRWGFLEKVCHKGCAFKFRKLSQAQSHSVSG